MKLNIGCGKTYKEGFINIDAFDSTVADKIMPANDLKFSSNSIDEIQSIQLIEHLGLFNAIYALSEWFRVLKPGGNLIIETPNLEKSFKNFINGDLETRKNQSQRLSNRERGKGGKSCQEHHWRHLPSTS